MNREELRPLARLVDDADALLFDFDGPLCDVFAGLPAPQVARSLEQLAGRQFGTDDPLEIVRLCYVESTPAVARQVEDSLIRFEIAAVQVSKAERAGVDAICVGQAAGYRVAIVTNNAPEAVAAFLRAEAMHQLVPVLVGRAYRHPELMKPDPWPIRRALDELGVHPGRALLIGDSRTDIEAGHAAGVRCVAFANKPGKRDVFTAAGAAAAVDDMGELLAVLEERAASR